MNPNVLLWFTHKPSDGDSFHLASLLALGRIPNNQWPQMQLVADLHLHSRHAKGVSPAMTLENIATWALRKGLNLLGTGDCLHPTWLSEIAGATESAEPGLLKLKPEIQARVWARVPDALRRPLRFVLSTEIDCLPPPKTKFQGLHHLVYFPSLEKVRALAKELILHGDLAEGRPTVNLTPLALLETVLAQGPDCHFAPAHVMNPWFSDLGTVGGETALDEWYVDLTSELLAVETGLTSIPPMCRRISSLDRHALFSCSDAHSLENLGREYTVLDVDLDYRAIFAALRSGAADKVKKTVKFPLYETRYFLNWCVACKRPFDAAICPVCGKDLVTGSRDRLEQIADRKRASCAKDDPPFQQLLPLAWVIANLLENNPDSPSVKRLVQTLLEQVGHERYLLTEATEAEIASSSTPQLARAICAQRTADTDYFKPKPAAKFDVGAKQKLLDLAWE